MAKDRGVDDNDHFNNNNNQKPLIVQFPHVLEKLVNQQLPFLISGSHIKGSSLLRAPDN